MGWFVKKIILLITVPKLYIISLHCEIIEVNPTD